jgi:hypothetical protein
MTTKINLSTDHQKLFEKELEDMINKYNTNLIYYEEDIMRFIK